MATNEPYAESLAGEHMVLRKGGLFFRLVEAFWVLEKTAKTEVFRLRHDGEIASRKYCQTRQTDGSKKKSRRGVFADNDLTVTEKGLACPDNRAIPPCHMIMSSESRGISGNVTVP